MIWRGWRREMLDRAQTSPDRDSDGFEERALWLGTTFGGAGRLHADLTPACAAALTVVLDALGQKAGPEDTRTAAQRRHDAVEEACRRLIGGQLIPGRDGQPPHLTVHIDLNDLRGQPGGSVLERSWTPATRGGRARVGVPDRPGRRGRRLRRGPHHDRDRADRLGRAGPAHHRLAHHPRPRPHRQPAGRPPGRATGRPRGRPAGRPRRTAACRKTTRTGRKKTPRTAGRTTTPTGRRTTTRTGRRKTTADGPPDDHPDGPRDDHADGPREDHPDGPREDHPDGPREDQADGRPDSRDADQPAARTGHPPGSGPGPGSGPFHGYVPFPGTGHGPGPGEAPAAAGDHDCGIAGCLEATRRRLQATILRWSLDLLSGPGGLASHLRGTLLGAPFNTPSQPLDLGRTTRTIPPHLRTAVIQRDQHCQFPGCTQPPSVCDVHHLIPWAKGGPTSLANLRLLCRFHHLIVIHRWRWTITCHPDGTTTATAPDGRTLHSHGPPQQAA